MTCIDSFEDIKDRTDRIDTMLNFMSCMAGVENKENGKLNSYTLEEISDFCGCDIMVIKRAEESALEKLRSNNPELLLYLSQ